ncbi:MAG: galactose-1-phosphate uridylyltransferase [Prochloraceae cyanobacterium]|nr:galactose-1-phosphate uridylyltransferase [Prochloraceae cyanobacterium]
MNHSEIGQIRLNIASREWVIYAPSRRKRPQDFHAISSSENSKKVKKNHCPFCDLNETIILEMPSVDDRPWQTRVIQNKFPALVSKGKPQRTKEGIYLTMPGYGQHEVVIETPDHEQNLALMPIAEIEVLIETYHQRYLALMEDSSNLLTIIFRNYGEKAGASLTHPHSQIIATSIVPQHRRWTEEEAQRYFDRWGQCVYCDILSHEQENGQRIIGENETFVAFVPYAASLPFEIWIMPKEHQADFGSITPQEKTDFAHLLKDVLMRLYDKLNNPDYNYVINTSARYKAEEPQVHWYCQILPRLTITAGFELATGININPSLPELDADFLNS